jgi:hypothetical protein
MRQLNSPFNNFQKRDIPAPCRLNNTIEVPLLWRGCNEGISHEGSVCGIGELSLSM